jgi:hypothetical protein
MKLFWPLLLAVCLCSCVNYQQIRYQKADLFKDKRVQKNIDRYEVFVHQGNRSFKIVSPEIRNDSIVGEIKQLTPYDVVKKPVGKEEVKLHRQDIHIYIAESDTSTNYRKIEDGKRVVVHSNQVDYLSAVSSNEKEMITFVMLIVGLSILAVVVIVAIFALILALIANAVVESTNASSDGSGAGSNASSDGSGASSDGSNGSGNSSDGSGSTSGSGLSGCYIATMAYGSYDAEPVLKLRRFRDEILLQRTWGRSFVKWYYRNSPIWVDRTKNFRIIHIMVRVLLNLKIRILEIVGLI